MNLHLSVSLLFGAISICTPSFALADADPSDLLLKAMRPVPDYGRQQNVGAAIRELKALGIVPFRPLRSIYTDYYRVQKPVMLLSHELVVVEEEYQSKFVGCCASEGGGFVVRLVGNLAKLEEWADRNQCSVTGYDSERDFLKSASIRFEMPKGKYAEVSCRIRDEK